MDQKFMEVTREIESIKAHQDVLLEQALSKQNSSQKSNRNKTVEERQYEMRKMNLMSKNENND